ncbi:hypothetical protein X772_11110 [Mesorhizobium sp. LSJC280B00]|nr:hypothetical protein X772_11110 [Mesorhizobium sp. LSJC280B00]
MFLLSAGVTAVGADLYKMTGQGLLQPFRAREQTRRDFFGYRDLGQIRRT